MKAPYFIRAALLLSAFSLLVSCQKETVDPASSQEQGSVIESKASPLHMPETRAYRDSFDMDLIFVPDIDGGWKPTDPDAPAWYYGEGQGNATHMGNVNIYFNTHTLRVAGTVTVFHAPVGMFYASKVAPFGIDPEDEVSAVVYDKKGNSIWLKTPEEKGWPSWHLPGTYVAMEGTMLIVGGSGKFEGATGEVTLHAEFDQASLVVINKQMIFTTATMWHKGWIRF